MNAQTGKKIYYSQKASFGLNKRSKIITDASDKALQSSVKSKTENFFSKRFAQKYKKLTFAAPTGCSVARYRATFGMWRPQVRILPPRRNNPKPVDQ